MNENLYRKYLQESLIPKRYVQEIELRPAIVDIDTFKSLSKIKDNVLDFVNEGRNILICSNNVGNGKTTLATKILKNYLKLVSNKLVKDPAMFVNVSNLLNKKKLAISDKQIQLEVAEIEKKIINAKLVVFDDLGVKDLSQYDMGNLYYWIDERTSNMRSCIYTSNLLPNQLENLLDARIFSRVVNYSDIFVIKDGDNRGSKR